jgi:RNA polymerase sigma-70 factor (ECF subfamily)
VVTDDRDLARHYRTIYGFVRQRSGSREDAEDVTQTVFVEAAANLTRVYAEGRSPLAWLYTVASRRLIDQARRRGRAPELVPLDAAAGLPGEGRYGEAIGRTLREAIELLPENQRRVVARRLIKGASFAEIAADEGATVPACKMRYMRALGTIRTQLEHEGLEP